MAAARFSESAPVQNTPSSDCIQFFGQVDLNHRSKQLQVALKDIDRVFSRTLNAEPLRGPGFPERVNRNKMDVAVVGHPAVSTAVNDAPAAAL